MKHWTTEARDKASARLRITHNTPAYRDAASARMRAYHATHPHARCRPVTQLTLDGETVATYPSGKAAVGFSGGGISGAIKTGKPYRGFFWKFS